MMLNDLGAYFTPALYAFEERELILDIFEEVSGARMMCNYMRFGGVVRDVTPNALHKIKDLVLERLPAKTDEMERLLAENEVLVSRLTGIKVVDGEFGDMNSYLTRVKASFPPGGEFNIAHLSAVFDYARYAELGDDR